MSDHLITPPAMKKLPHEEATNLLLDPHPVDEETYRHLSWWMRPKPVVPGKTVLHILQEAGGIETRNEGRRLIKQNGLSWNGEKVKSQEMIPDFIENKWGVFKIGKRFIMVEAK